MLTFLRVARSWGHALSRALTTVAMRPASPSRDLTRICSTAVLRRFSFRVHCAPGNGDGGLQSDGLVPDRESNRAVGELCIRSRRRHIQVLWELHPDLLQLLHLFLAIEGLT